MTSSATNHPTTDATNQTPAPASILERIAAHARATSSKSRFWSSVIRDLAATAQSPYAALHVRWGSEVLQDDCHTGTTDPKFWKASLQDFLTSALDVSAGRSKVLKTKNGVTRIAFISAPILDANGVRIGAMAMVVGPVTEQEVSARVTEMEAAARFASHLAAFLGRSTPTAGPAAAPAAPSITAKYSAVGQGVTEATTPHELAFALTNEVRGALSAEMVAIGLVRRGRVEILCISGLDEVKPQSPGTVVLKAAMEECVDAKEVLVVQREEVSAEERLSSGHRLHRQWHGASKGDAVASIPLMSGDQAIGVLSLRCRPDKPFTTDVLKKIRARSEPLGRVMLLARRANRGLPSHLLDRILHGWDCLTKPGHAAFKLACAGITILTFWFFFGTVSYNLPVPCELRPGSPHVISTPFDGVLAEVLAIEGDRVKAGDVLCRIDTSDLELQRSELIAQRAVHEVERDRALAVGSPVEAQLALANQRLVEARLDILDRRIEQAQLRAPIDGVVVSGDLRKRAGSVTSLGEPLLTVAPAGKWTLQLSVNESSVDEITTGLRGSFSTIARPELAQPIQITRVLPSAQSRSQQNAFVAEAEVDAQATWMRPGMEGVARLHLGERPVWWAALHRVIDYLRLNLWL